MTDLAVDIITPSYNQSDYIRDTIESVATQTYPNVTHHVIDGGSDDGTISILKEYEDIEWISEKDRGQTHAINKGFDRATGDIVGWLNSDDPLVFRETIEKVVEQFSRTDADVLVGHSITIGAENELRRAHFIPEFNKERIKYLCYLFQPSVFFRSNVVNEHKLDEERDFSMDYEYWLRLRNQDYKWVHANRILAADRNHPERKIIAQASKSQADTRRLREELGINQDYRFLLRQIYERFRLRTRRIYALPMLLDLLATPKEKLAFDLSRQSYVNSIRSQLLGRKRAL